MAAVCCVNFDLTSGDMKTLATAYSACSGHGKNQSMLVLLTIPVSDTYGRYGKQTQQARVSIYVSRQADIKTFRKNIVPTYFTPNTCLDANLFLATLTIFYT